MKWVWVLLVFRAITEFPQEIQLIQIIALEEVLLAVLLQQNPIQLSAHLVQILVVPLIIQRTVVVFSP
jgi:hypothetical protein